MREAVALLAALAPTLEQVMETVRKKAYVIPDGTVLPIDRIAADRPYYSGKKKHHGMNVQVLADPAGRLVWASDALPGAVHDLTAARTHGIPAALGTDGIKYWVDKAHQGAGQAVRVPFRGKGLRGWSRRHNRDHAKVRSLGERAVATLKCWRLLRKLRCSTTRITAVVRAVMALERTTSSGWKRLSDTQTVKPPAIGRGLHCRWGAVPLIGGRWPARNLGVVFTGAGPGIARRWPRLVAPRTAFFRAPVRSVARTRSSS